jgi:putative ABC transport system substrate-binding protein
MNPAGVLKLHIDNYNEEVTDMVHTTFFRLVVLFPFIFLQLFNCQQKKSDIRIGIISVIEHPALNLVRDGFKESLSKAGYKDIFYDYKNAKGSTQNALQIVSTFKGNDYKMILCIGTPVAKVAAENIKDIPILFAAVTDPVGAQIVSSLEKPGANISGTSDMNPVRDQILLIREIVKNASKVGFLYNPGESNSVSILKIAREEAKKIGMEIIEGTANNTNNVQSAVASLVGRVDSILMPTDNTFAAAEDVIIEVCKKNKIPYFSTGAEAVNKGGAVAALCVNYYNLGRQTGEMAIKILKGAATSDMPVEFQKDYDLVVSEKAAKDIGVEIPESVKKRAKLVR